MLATGQLMNDCQVLNLNATLGDYSVSVSVSYVLNLPYEFQYFEELLNVPSGESENHTNPV